MINTQFKRHLSATSHNPNRPNGFTLIELMIVIAIIAIILTLALPVYSSYTIRAKVSEAIGVAAGAKTSTADTCQGDPTLTDLTNSKAGYAFGGSTYIDSIEITGTCEAPLITIITQNTGADTSPTLTLTGDASVGGRFAWTCASSNDIHVPGTCRS
jgi:type IV pilus assembly protein PilA